MKFFRGAEHLKRESIEDCRKNLSIKFPKLSNYFRLSDTLKSIISSDSSKSNNRKKD